MTPEEWVQGVSTKCGLSADIVRAVQKAEAQHAVESLLKGENALLLGRCILKPRVKNGEVKISAVATTSINRALMEQCDIETVEKGTEKPAYVDIPQLEGLI